MAKRVRGFETVGDMLRSLAVVGAFVAVILIITLRQTPDRIKAVDPTETFAGVTQAAPFEAELPGTTPEGWTVTSARVTLPSAEPYSWYVGYSTDKEAFVAVTQIYGDEDDTKAALKEIGVKGEEVGTVEIDGDTWTKLEEPDGTHRALVRTVDGSTAEEKGEPVTTVVLGTAPFDVLQSVADSLRPARPDSTPSPTSTKA